MQINPAIFKAYDVRGVYPSELDEDIFYKFGKVFCAYLLGGRKGKKGEKFKIAVGQDVRKSSPTLSESFIRGVLDFGFDVVDFGVVTTPMFYFGVIKTKVFGGAMITASHNPPEYNGIKFVRQTSEYIGGEDIQDLYKMCVMPGQNFLAGENKRGEYEKFDVGADYLDFIAKGFQMRRKIKLVVDASCGTTALFLKDFLKRLGVEYVLLFFEPDGSFCDHDPNPLSKQAQRHIKEKILEEKADFGVLFDGDGDRVVFVDENAEVIGGDISGGILAEGFLKAGDKFGYVITSTRNLREHFESRKIKTKMIKVGRFFINKEMRKNGIDFCSEFSGHFYFKHLNYTESTFYALRLMLEILDKNPALKISDLTKFFRKYSHSGEINIRLKSFDEWPTMLERIKNYYRNDRQTFNDGILVENSDGDGEITWWFNIRSSNTEPIARLVVEAKNKKLMEEKKKEILLLLGQKD